MFVGAWPITAAALQRIYTVFPLRPRCPWWEAGNLSRSTLEVYEPQIQKSSRSGNHKDLIYQLEGTIEPVSDLITDFMRS
jgi:hypothetical protein